MKPKVAVVFGLVLLFSPLLCWAQTQLVTTIRGTVKRVSHPNGTGTHVWLDNAGKTQEVCLGDTRFLQENGVVPKLGDVVEVTGGNDGRVFVANAVRAGGRTLDLQAGSAAVGTYSHHHSQHDCDDRHHEGHHDCGHGDHHHGHE
jgi:hypothetical protein